MIQLSTDPSLSIAAGRPMPAPGPAGAGSFAALLAPAEDVAPVLSAPAAVAIDAPDPAAIVALFAPLSDDRSPATGMPIPPVPIGVAPVMVEAAMPGDAAAMPAGPAPDRQIDAGPGSPLPPAPMPPASPERAVDEIATRTTTAAKAPRDGSPMAMPQRPSRAAASPATGPADGRAADDTEPASDPVPAVAPIPEGQSSSPAPTDVRLPVSAPAAPDRIDPNASIDRAVLPTPDGQISTSPPAGVRLPAPSPARPAPVGDGASIRDVVLPASSERVSPPAPTRDRTPVASPPDPASVGNDVPIRGMVPPTSRDRMASTGTGMPMSSPAGADRIGSGGDVVREAGPRPTAPDEPSTRSPSLAAHRADDTGATSETTAPRPLAYGRAANPAPVDRDVVPMLPADAFTIVSTRAPAEPQRIPSAQALPLPLPLPLPAHWFVSAAPQTAMAAASSAPGAAAGQVPARAASLSDIPTIVSTRIAPAGADAASPPGLALPGHWFVTPAARTAIAGVVPGQMPAQPGLVSAGAGDTSGSGSVPMFPVAGAPPPVAAATRPLPLAEPVPPMRMPEIDAAAATPTARPVPGVALAAPPAPGEVSPMAAARAWSQGVDARGEIAETPSTPPAAPIAATTPAAVVPLAVAAAVDLRQPGWPHDMIGRIEQLRDAADAADTRIRLVPDALGGVEIDLRREGDTLHVRFTAEQPQTRAILQEAQPRLAEAAEQRGLRLGQTSVDGGGHGPAQGQGQGQQRPPAPPPPPAPSRTRASATAGPDLPADATRLA